MRGSADPDAGSRRPVRVLLDATPIPAERGGVGRYVEAIVPALVDRGVDLTVVAKRSDAPGFVAAGADVIVAPDLVGRRAGRFLWEQTGLPGLAKRLGVDVLHSIHYTFPLAARVARVVGVHDLTFFTQPDVHSAVKGRFFRWWIRRAARARVTVIAPSAATAAEYSRLTGADRRSVHVALHGYDRDVFRPPTEGEIAAFGRRIDATGWIGFLGTLEPRKNVPALIAGYVDAVRARPSAERPPLLLAGGRGWDAAVEPSVRAAVDEGFDVRLLGYLDRSDLSAFLGGGLAFAYPSLGEGFGLPVLESMATGAIVLTTDRLAIPEVGGDAVVYVEPTTDGIGGGIARILDADAARLAELRAAALARASEFTWARCAQQHDAAYRSAAGRPIEHA